MNTTTRKASKQYYAVSAFHTAAEDCEHHIIIRHQPQWMSSSVKSVVFSNLLHGVAVEIVVHWTQWTRYLKKANAGKNFAGEIKAVILEDGSRIYCGTRSVHYHDEKSYAAAPMFARDEYAVEVLGSRTTLLEVRGVFNFAYTKRTPEHIAQLIRKNSQQIDSGTSQPIEGAYLEAWQLKATF